jgi:hypothetical protein
VLVPIALTPERCGALRRAFRAGGGVAQRARRGRALRHLAPRAGYGGSRHRGARALFAPLPNLGLIILDEEHDEAYKQDPPFAVSYHARDAAVEYARRLGAVCVLGSATPDVISYYRARQGQYGLLELPLRIMGHARRLQEQAERLHGLRYQPVARRRGEPRPLTCRRWRSWICARGTGRQHQHLQPAVQAALAETLARRAGHPVLNRAARPAQICRDCGGSLVTTATCR